MKKLFIMLAVMLVVMLIGTYLTRGAALGDPIRNISLGTSIGTAKESMAFLQWTMTLDETRGNGSCIVYCSKCQSRDITAMLLCVDDRVIGVRVLMKFTAKEIREQPEMVKDFVTQMVIGIEQYDENYKLQPVEKTLPGYYSLTVRKETEINAFEMYVVPGPSGDPDGIEVSISKTIYLGG
jgi:hypothetical protein